MATTKEWSLWLNQQHVGPCEKGVKCGWDWARKVWE